MSSDLITASLAVLVALLTSLHMLLMRAAAIRAATIVVVAIGARITVGILVALLARFDVLLVRAALIVSAIGHVEFLSFAFVGRVIPAAQANGMPPRVFLHIADLGITTTKL